MNPIIKNVVILIYIISFINVIHSSFDFIKQEENSGLGGELFYDYNLAAESNSFYNASVAFNQSASGFLYNPGNLIEQKYKKLGLFYEINPFNIKINSVSMLYPLSGKYAFGLCYVSASVDDIEKTNIYGENLGNFSYSESALVIGLARNIYSKFNAGLNLKVINKKMDNSSDLGIGFDIGLKLLPYIWNPFDFGIYLGNIYQPNLNKDYYPVIIKSGIHKSFLNNRVEISYDHGYIINNMKRISAIGMKYKILNSEREIAISAGYNYKEISAGMDFSIDNYKLNYSIDYFDSNLIHKIGINYIFGLSPTEEQSRITGQRLKLEQEKKVNQTILEGINLLTKNNKRKAEEKFNEAIALNQEDKELKLIINDLLAGKNKFDIKETEKDIINLYQDKKYYESKEKIIALLGNDPQNIVGQKYHVLVNFQIFINEGNFAEARNELARAIEKYPDDKDLKKLFIKLNNAMDYLKSGIK